MGPSRQRNVDRTGAPTVPGAPTATDGGTGITVVADGATVTLPGAPSVDPTSPVITAGDQTPLPADQATAILASCAPTGGPWQSVIAVKVAHPTKNEDSMVIGTNSNHEYVFCTGLGTVGRSDRSISYGTETKEWPALLAGGAYALTTSTPYNPDYTHPPVGYVHAYAKDGSKLYDTPLH